MYSFILGFQRLVWCPKWTPASSNSFMVMLANQPPHLVCIFRMPCGCSRLPFPSPHEQYGKNLTPVSCFQFLVSSPETRNQKLDTVLYLLLYWNRFLAPFCPYFLRSFERESRLTNPSALSFLRSSASNSMSARAIPSFTASAWPFTPPPETLAMTLNPAAVSVDSNGCLAAERCAGVTKYCSNGRPLTLNSPLPGRR